MARGMGAAVLAAVALTSCATFQEAPIEFGVPEENYISTEEHGRTYVLDRGEGPTVLLVHGYGSAHVVWLGLVERLVAAGYRVLAVDLPGFGYSDRNPGDYSPEGLAAHLVQILEEKGVERADVIAHSWGCSIALRLALDHPERVNRLVLTSAWVYEEQLNPFIRWARVPGIGEGLYTTFYRERTADRYELSWFDPERMVTQEAIDAVERALNRPGTVAAALAAAREQRYAEIQQRYPEVEAESLLIWGRYDHVSTLEFALRLEGDLPNAHLLVFERCGHVPMLERVGRYEREVMQFLGPASPPSASVVRSPPVEPEAVDEPAPSAEPEPAAAGAGEARPWGTPPPEQSSPNSEEAP